ncbi:MAG TPA: hypothetical protein PLM14_14495 [Candidatus Hydrogenedentes bacterium]|nr:hypothetical protein [Candidatus Hydrogenedentota bacterium]HQE84208.1 hypothetical protein [Candidatus Hydrogenedentota bacterium]HQH53889.1 hypothetical protein [Candidatus Hydrogenedentota bacterium]HQM48960.1 hypothetical protein [Candidatus Hydrogenedentota bacterium]
MRLEDDARDSLDQRIDAALRSEASVCVPDGFHARLKRHLCIARMLERERRAFRVRMVRVAGMTALVVAVAILVGSYLDVSHDFLWDAPGFWGRLDYLAAAANRIWLMSESPALSLSLTAVVATLSISGAFVGFFREPRRP